MRSIDKSETGNKVSAAADGQPLGPISMDYIASVADRADALAHEIRARVMAPGGRVFVNTSNRFSLTPVKP